MQAPKCRQTGLNESIIHPKASDRPEQAGTLNTGDPTPSSQSQSFSQSYGSILPTSLDYFSLRTRGCEPWRPDAVVGTAWGAIRLSLGVSRAGRCAPRAPKRGALFQLNRPISGQSNSRAIWLLDSKDNAVRGNGLRSQVPLCYHTISTPKRGNFNPLPFRSARPKPAYQRRISPLGPANPCPIAVHMEPFSTSVFKVLI